jgi:hypothetical protein
MSGTTIYGSTAVCSANGLLIGNGGVTATCNYLPKFTGTSTIGNSILQDDGTNVSIGYTTNPSLYKLDVNGTGRFSSTLYVSNGNIIFGLDGTYGSPYYSIGFGLTNGTSRMFGGTGVDLYIASATGQGINFRANGGTTNHLTIASTGAATFSSSVTAGGDITIPNGNYYYAKRSTGGSAINVLGFASGSDTLTLRGGTSGASVAMQFQDTGGTVMSLYNSNVGIGTSIPTANLVVNSNSETKVIIQTSNPSGNSNVVLEMNGNYYYDSIIRNNSAGGIAFQTGTTERMRITSTGIACFACQVCAPTLAAPNIAIPGSNGSAYICFYSLYSGNPGQPGFAIANTSGTTTFQHNANGGSTTSLGTLCGLSSVYTATNFRVGSGTSAGNTVDPAITTGGCTKVGIWYSNDCVGFGAGGYGLYINGAGNTVIDSGKLISNSVITQTIGGTMAGYTAAYYDFPVWDDTDQGQMIEIKAFFDHFYNWNYGAHYYIYLTSRATNYQYITMFSCPTSNGGSWMAYKPNATTLRVCKIAGSYVGGGAFWVQVTSKQP